MSLSKQAIKEFRDIYRQEFKEEISDAKAQELGESLLSLFRIIYQPIPNEKTQKPKSNQNRKP